MQGEHFGWKDLYDLMGVDQDFSGAEGAGDGSFIDYDEDDDDPG